MKRVYKISLLLTFTIFFFICFACYFADERETIEDLDAHIQGDAVKFSMESGYYAETIEISLRKDMEFPWSAEIYYTLDGNNPTQESLKYEHAIELGEDGDLKVYPLKAVVYYDGNYSKVYERTYIIGKELSYDMDIVSITSDSINLYDYETGILVPGKTYDDNANIGGEGFIQGNYSQRSEEWIRDAHMALFDSDGGLKEERKVGLSVSGGTSASNDVKSLKIYANHTNDISNDKLIVEFEDCTNLIAREYSFVEEYSSIRLRAGSQDMTNGNIRSAVVSRLAQQSGFDGCTETKRCITFLNGNFYGIFDIQQNYSNSHLAKRFGLENPDYIEKIKWSDFFLWQIPEVAELMMADLNGRKEREALEQVIDMDNYLLYFAVCVLCNNTDWPDNNFEIWRYSGERMPENDYTDGRWRFLIYDTDLTWPSSYLFPEFFEGCREDTFQAIMESKYRGGVSFAYVMKSKHYRDKYITIISDLLNTSFTSDNVIGIMKEENAKICAAREAFYDREFVDFSEQSVEEMIKQAAQRKAEMESNFSTYFGLNQKYDMLLKTTEGIAVSWNNMEIWGDSLYKNKYYYGVDITMSADAYPGYQFLYWSVNGEKFYGRELQITNELIKNDIVEIDAIASPIKENCLIISGISAKGDMDWIQVTNVGRGVEECGQYYLTDDGTDLMRYQLPDIKLRPGESVTINGCKNRREIGEYICNFALKAKETITLSDGIHRYDEVVIPRMTEIEFYGRYDNSNTWKFFRKYCADES